MPARWASFASVGLGGFVVQIASVTLLSYAGVSDALATASGVELAILHNFAWHVRWTWRDRAADSPLALWAQLFRFNVAAGLVSLPGNVGLALLLAGGLHMPVALANLIAVALLGVLNYVLADRWAFTR